MMNKLISIKTRKPSWTINDQYEWVRWQNLWISNVNSIAKLLHIQHTLDIKCWNDGQNRETSTTTTKWLQKPMTYQAGCSGDTRQHTMWNAIIIQMQNQFKAIHHFEVWSMTDHWWMMMVRISIMMIVHGHWWWWWWLINLFVHYLGKKVWVIH